MRKIALVLIFVALLSLNTTVNQALAQGKVASVLISPDTQVDNVFTFEQLGYSEKALIGPYDTSSIFFSLPANLELAPGGSISLKFNVSASASFNSAASENWIGGTLLVYFNEELIDTIVLDTLGEVTRDIAIPEKALKAVEDDGRHRLRLFLNADIHCEIQDTLLLISKESSFALEFNEVRPLVDLSLLPRPIFQPDSIIPSNALIVIPDDAEDFELQAGLTVAAGLGSITNGELSLSLVKVENLTTDMRETSHLLFVGLAQKFQILYGNTLPVGINNNGLDLINTDDGVIQIAESPWSPSSVITFIGGNTEDAVVKASQAFTTGKVIAVQRPDVSVISTVNSTQNQSTAAVDRTFLDLGYNSQTMGLFGDNYIVYDFFVSPEQADSTGAYLDLTVYHSDMLDFQKTGITVILNDEVVGGIRLSEESPTTARVNLTPDVMRRGMNRLEIVSDLVPYFTCYSTDLQSTWITISETSLIHLPVTTPKLDTGNSINLEDYPYMFLGGRNLDDVAFVLASNDSVLLDYATKVAFFIGSKSNVPVVDLKATFADNVSDSIQNEYNLLIFGRASQLPIVAQLNDALPAPFELSSDLAIQPTMLVNYSLLPDTSVGYLQLLTSPWNQDRVILTVMGNTDAGIPMAGDALAKDELASQLAGNFAILYADQILTTDTRLGISKDGLVAELPVAVTVTPTPNIIGQPDTAPDIVERPVWVLPTIVVITVVILALLLIFGRNSIKRESIREDFLQKDSQPHRSDNE